MSEWGATAGHSRATAQPDRLGYICARMKNDGGRHAVASLDARKL